MFDLDFDDLRKTLEKIDPSDIRVLGLGLVLLLVPVLFLVWSGGVGEKGGFARREAESRLVGGRGGFRFIDHAKGTAGQTPQSGGGGSILAAPKADSEWETAMRTVEESPLYIPDLSPLPPSSRMLFEAQFNPKLIRAQFLMNKDKNDQAEEILKEILSSDVDNPYLKYPASMLLCELYDKEGRTAEMEKELGRTLEFMGIMFKGGLMNASIQKGLAELRKMPAILSKMEGNPAVAGQLQDFLGKQNIKMSVPDFLTTIRREMPMIPGLPGAR